MKLFAIEVIRDMGRKINNQWFAVLCASDRNDCLNVFIGTYQTHSMFYMCQCCFTYQQLLLQPKPQIYAYHVNVDIRRRLCVIGVDIINKMHGYS